MLLIESTKNSIFLIKSIGNKSEAIDYNHACSVPTTIDIDYLHFVRFHYRDCLHSEGTNSGVYIVHFDSFCFAGEMRRAGQIFKRVYNPKR